MKTVYLLWWDNGGEYSDHVRELRGVFSSRDLAERFLAKHILDGHRSGGKFEILEEEVDPVEA